MNLISKYFNWLQLDNPTGEVERYPEINDRYESSQKNVFISGDLTGIPLLKFAAESGANIVRQIAPELEKDSRADEDVYDVVIIGAGPSGISAALECESLGLSYTVIEASQIFNTLVNFPKGKLILAKPDDYEPESLIKISNGNKESLLAELNSEIKDKNLNVTNGVMVQKILQKKEHLEIESSEKKFSAKKIILAIGKSGNSRQLKVPGEELPKVFNKVYDPGEFSDKDILVVGGGDSALEASTALAKAGNRVTHSYRKDVFSRPKQENLTEFNSLVKEGKINFLPGSTVKQINQESVEIESQGKTQSINNDVVYTLIGKELPLSFFKRSKIKMEGEKDFAWIVFLTAMVSFFTMLYFGKSGFATDIFKDSQSILSKINAYSTLPFESAKSWQLLGYKWYSSINFYLGWLGSLIWIISGSIALGIMLIRREKYFGSAWNKIKYGYFILIAGCFTWIYFKYMLNQKSGWVFEPTYYYSLFYCTTMALFGIRRAMVKKTRYIKYQMSTLIFIQVVFLFLLPYHLYDLWILPNFDANGYIIKEMFPDGKWSSFGFILFWPLNISNFGTSTFWTWFPFVQTFGILWYLMYKFGKGAYCGWICSCGGMAESLGDEYRDKTPHGPTAKKWENMGQVILVWIVLATTLHYFNTHFNIGSKLLSDTMWGMYRFSIDVFFAGVLGLGVYFFLGGRIWCRYGCPLAAIMHIYSRFSVYRIFSEKKKCISCNMCTKVCHMGIDVMNYANKGVPMNDVECVRCSACVQTCPTDVLSFGEIPKTDTLNITRMEIPSYGKEVWKAGIN